MFLCSFQNSVATYFIRLINSLSNIKKKYSDLICHECPRQPLSVCIFYKSCKIRGEAKPWQVWIDLIVKFFVFQWFVQWNRVPGFRLCVPFLSKKFFPFFYSSIKVKSRLMTFPMLMLGALPSCQGNAGTAERFSQDQRHLGPLGWRVSAIMADLVNVGRFSRWTYASSMEGLG